jgi:hypothetical protein
MTDYIFNTPTVDEHMDTKHPLFRRFKLTHGISIVKSGGVYSQVRGVDSDNIAGYDEFYLGGHKHTVTSAVRTALIAGGVDVTSANFTAI